MVLFETERLRVRRFTVHDADVFFRFNSHPDVMRYIRPVKTREECDAFLLENLDFYQPTSCLGRFLVADKRTEDYIGSFSLLYLSGGDDIHIGYGLMPEHWGKGYASELLKEGVDFFFNSTKRLILFAITEPSNIASQKVLEKAGFFLKGSLQQDKILDVFYMTREAHGAKIMGKSAF